MEDNKKYKILVIEADETLQARIEKLLTSQNYLVTCFKSSSAAFSELESSESEPYAVAIVSYKMPKMQGDEVLMEIRQIVPDTQKILVTDALSVKIIVKAINTAKIVSCLSLPFKDKNLIDQVKHACNQFQEMQKQKNLLRVTKHQNSQLYKIAKLFKEKDGKHIEKIEKRKMKIRLLKSKAKHGPDTQGPISLKGVIQEKNVTTTPEGFGEEFLILKDQIKEILVKAAGGSVSIDDIPYNKVRDIAIEKDKSLSKTDKILELSFMLLKKTAFLGIDALEAVQESSPANDSVEITFSDDKIKAFIKLKVLDTKILNVRIIREVLEENGIKIGIKDDDFIKSWLLGASPDDDPVVIAKGRKPKKPKNAEVKYHFSVDFKEAGKVDPDGRIDFKDRGDIPFVEKDTFLAVKIFPEDGIPGLEVTGEVIPVEEPLDMAFGLGTGVRASEDGVKIYADIDGQPGVDPLGNISVFAELKIDGDIGFESGNIDFDGNITVTGVLKEGFSVKGASLTIEQIEGADVDLTGNLNVSSGIVNANLIKVKGDIHAKYVNNSKIYGFGDLEIQKEILDSKIRLSGACINEKGTIIASDLCAKMGISGGNIGTIGSRPSTLKVGVDDHTNFLVKKIDSELKVNNDTVTVLKNEISELSKEEQVLHVTISKQAYTQDRTQLKLKEVEKNKPDLQTSGNVAALQNVQELEEQMVKQAKEAEDAINDGFQRQDAVAQEIILKKDRIRQFEELNQGLVGEKRKLLEFTAKKEPVAEVRVAKKVLSGTKIKGPNSFVIIKDVNSKCRIMEVKQNDEKLSPLDYYEMTITDL